MIFFISVTVAATDQTVVKHKSSHHKGSHVAKKVKTELDPDPDPASHLTDQIQCRHP